MATEKWSAYAAALSAQASLTANSTLAGYEAGTPNVAKNYAASLWLSSLPVGATIYVDAVNGNDTTAKRGRADLPFATLDNAVIATGISALDMIYIRNGSYAPAGAILVPSGVSVWGESMAGVVVTMAGSYPDMLQPGSGSSVNNLCVFGNMTVIGQRADGPIGINTPGGSTAVSTNVLLKNVTINGTVDCIFISLGTLGSAYWRVENCYFSSTFDTFFGNAGTVSSQSLAVDMVDCVHTISGGNSNTAYHAINCGAAQTAGASVYVRDLGGVMSVTGSNSSNVAKAVAAGSGVTVELHGTAISVSQTVAGSPLAVLVNSGGTVKYNAACSFDLSKVSNAGTFSGLVSQAIGTSGTVVGAGAADGTSPTLTLSATSNDTTGAVNITLGSSPTTGILAVVGFGQPKYSTFPMLSPGNAATSALVSTSLWPYTTSLPAINIYGASALPSPSIVGVYLPSAIYNGQPVYTCAAVGYSIWWNSTNWIISTLAGTNGTNYWTGGTSVANPWPANASYTPTSPATGTITGATAGAGGFLIDSGSSALTGGPFSFNYAA